MVGNWFVYEPDTTPDDPFWPKPMLYGPFGTKDEAFEYANELHGEDGIGNCVILQPTKP
jgi:hypothetical protein